MSLRSGRPSGNGMPHIEVRPADEQPPASPAVAVRPGRGTNGQFARGNTEQRAKLVKPGPRGFTAAFKVDPDYVAFERWGRRYASHRRAELARSHGGELSAGVAALIESAGSQLAASRFLHAKAATTGDADLFKQASRLANDARQNELAGWELASREAASRTRTGKRGWQSLLAAPSEPTTAPAGRKPAVEGIVGGDHKPAGEGFARAARKPDGGAS